MGLLSTMFRQPVCLG